VLNGSSSEVSATTIDSSAIILQSTSSLPTLTSTDQHSLTTDHSLPLAPPPRGTGSTSSPSPSGEDETGTTTSVSDAELTSTLTSELDLTLTTVISGSVEHHVNIDPPPPTTIAYSTSDALEMVNERRLSRIKDTNAMESDDSDLDLDQRHKELEVEDDRQVLIV